MKPRPLVYLSLLLPLLCAAIMVWGWPFALDNDIYLHLKQGQRISQSHRLPLVDDYSYVAAGELNEFVDCWLSEWVIWNAFRSFGKAGVRLLNFILVSLLVTMVWSFVKGRTKNIGLASLTAFLVLLIQREVQVLRPLVFGEVILCFFILYLLDSLKPLSWRRFALCIGLTLLWTNMHGSVVLLGVIFLIFAFCLGVHTFRREAPSKLDGLRTLSLLSWLPIFLASLINPLGYEIYPLAWRVTQIGKNIVGNAEWRSPFLGGVVHCDPVGRVIVILAILTIALMWGKKNSYAHRLYFAGRNALFLLLATSSMRHTFFLIFPVALCAVEIGERFPIKSRMISWVREGSVVLLSLALVFHLEFYRSESALPSIEKVANFIEDIGLEGNLYNPPGWGAYLIFRHFPRIKVAYDSRGWVHRRYFERERMLYDALGTRSLLKLLEEIPQETDFLLLPSSLLSISSLVPTESWVGVYENNEAFLMIRRSEKNRETLKRIGVFYRQRAIAFDDKAGFAARVVFQSAKTWFLSQMEGSSLGLWPKPEYRKKEIERQLRYFSTRKILDLYAAEKLSSP